MQTISSSLLVNLTRSKTWDTSEMIIANLGYISNNKDQSIIWISPWKIGDQLSRKKKSMKIKVFLMKRNLVKRCNNILILLGHSFMKRKLKALNIQMRCLLFLKRNLEIFVFIKKKSKLSWFMIFTLLDTLEKFKKLHSLLKKIADQTVSQCQSSPTQITTNQKHHLNLILTI